MFKIARSFILTIILFSFVTFPIFAENNEASPSTKLNQVIDSYTLFWPIVAGKTPADSFYFLKTFKENLDGIFMFNNAKKGEYELTLATKRLLEAEKLANDEKKDLAIKTFNTVDKHIKKAGSLLEDAKDKDVKNYGVVYPEVKNKISNISLYLPQLKSVLGGDFNSSIDSISTSATLLQNKFR